MNFFLSFHGFLGQAVGTGIFLFLAIIFSPWHLIVVAAFSSPHPLTTVLSLFFLNISKCQEVSIPSHTGWWLSLVEGFGFPYERYLGWHRYKWQANNFDSKTNSPFWVAIRIQIWPEFPDASTVPFHKCLPFTWLCAPQKIPIRGGERRDL